MLRSLSPIQYSKRLFCTKKYPITSSSINTKTDLNAYNKMHKYYPSALQPVLLNWYLAFILKGAIDTGIFDIIPYDDNNNNNNNHISINDICNKCNIEKDITYRALRFMSSMGYTKEISINNEKGYFIHTKESSEFRKNGGNSYYSLKFYLDPYVANGRFKFDEILRGTYGDNIYTAIYGETYFDRLSHDNETRNSKNS